MVTFWDVGERIVVKTINDITMTDKEIILNEIERRLAEYKDLAPDYYTYQTDSNVRELKELTGFINSLPEKPVDNDAMQAARKYVKDLEERNPGTEEAFIAGWRASSCYNLTWEDIRDITNTTITVTIDFSNNGISCPVSEIYEESLKRFLEQKEIRHCVK